jgi:hypothetical protein
VTDNDETERRRETLRAAYELFASHGMTDLEGGRHRPWESVARSSRSRNSTLRLSRQVLEHA